MKLGAAFATLLLSGLLACSRTTTPAATRGANDAGRATSTVAADTAVDTDTPAHAPRHAVTITSRKPISIADAAPAQGPSAAMPSGSIYVSAVLEAASPRDPSDPGDPTIVEWDIAGERIVAQTSLAPKDPHEHVQVLRLATTKHRVYVTSECWAPGCPVRLTVLNRQLNTLGQKTLPVGSAVSIEATEKYVAVAIAQHQSKLRPLVVSLFDAASLTPIATKELATSGGPISGFVRANALELAGDRLYVAARGRAPVEPERDDEGRMVGSTSVFSFDLPALTLRSTFKSNAAASLEPSLIARGKQLLLFAGDEVVELNADLRPFPTLAETSSHVAIAALSSTGQLFAGGTEAQRGELFPGARFPCTATWSADAPLLVCDSDSGLRLARFGK